MYNLWVRFAGYILRWLEVPAGDVVTSIDEVYDPE
jgi:hypothetical protein